MRWEDLKVYRPLSKEELKPAYKDFTQIMAANLKQFGFHLVGRKLVTLSNDLFHIIHLDTRGSWMGLSEYFKTEISLVAVCDKSPFIRKWEQNGAKKIEELAIGIRDNYRITKEYPLLANFLTEKIIEHVLPYFDKYDTSLKVLADRDAFKYDLYMTENANLLLFAELQNGINVEAEEIIDKTLMMARTSNEYIDELNIFKDGLQTGNWDLINQKLASNKQEVFKKHPSISSTK
ncbi:hypothetical protein [Chitinophaga polysaccharea]|uniref:hypothetical protein n=1 Tax=Chitinophaga polysaccharea TaxID=1293035 RepID=UPI00115BC4AF|nr:hypothetical protein [Chitinophaga polysaccharea]